MSAYLSAANRVANTARGKATNEIKRQSKRQTSTVNAGVDAWTPKPQAKAQPARKRRLGYFSAATNRLASQPRGLPGLVRPSACSGARPPTRDFSGWTAALTGTRSPAT